MFLNKSDPNHYSDDSDVFLYSCAEKKKKTKKQTRVNPCPFKSFQQLQKA